MTQFIRRNIDIISSKSRPPTANSSIEQYDPDIETLTPLEPHHTILNSGLSSQLFENYTMYPKSSKNSGVTGAANVSDTNDLTSQSFQSAYETLPSGTTKLPALPNRSEYELDTQTLDQTNDGQHVVHQGYDSLSSIGNNNNNQEPIGPSTAASWFSLPSALGTRIWNLYRYIVERRWFERHQVIDPERQPLFHSEPDHDEQDDYGSPLLDSVTRQTVYAILAVAVGISMVLTIVLTGDTQLLQKIIRAMICYLFGSTAATGVFGQDFCPNLN